MASLIPFPKKLLTDKLAMIDKMAETFNTKAGKVIAGRIGNNPAIAEKLTIQYIPTTSVDLNEAMGGGYPCRKCTIIAGLPDSGKTSRLLEDIGYNMQLDHNFVAGWLESEFSLKLDYVCQTFGIDPARFLYIEVNRGQGAEITLDNVETILSAGVVDIFVVNSLKCLVPTAEKNKSLAEAIVAEQARMNTRMSRKFIGLVGEHDTAFVIITHLSTMIGTMSRDPLIIAGGHAIAHWSSVTLDMRKKAIMDTDPVSKEEAIKVGVTVKKNHCVPDRNPYVKCTYFAVFGEGTEQILTSLEKAVEQNIIDRRGSWLYWYEADGSTVKYSWQGKEKYRSFMKEHTNVFSELQNLINGTVEQLTVDEINSIKAEEQEIEANAVIEKDKLKKPIRKTAKKAS